ncbi:MAG: hypothetical protein WCO57_08600 [Verrucomicrobiota bacterium]
MNGRGMALVNAAGCLVLGLLLVMEWRKNLALVERTHDLKVSMVTAGDQLAAERERTEILQHEQTLLKESIESMQKAAEATGKVLAERDGQVAALEAQTATLEAQLKTWQAAIAERDERIRTLNSDLTNARRCLNEAIAKLKAVAER